MLLEHKSSVCCAVKHCVKLRESAAHRRQEGSILVVGQTAVQQLQPGSVQALLVTEPDQAPAGATDWQPGQMQVSAG